ncbi:MAG: AlpA family phage regulatory protein [Rhodospirillaceae bacterium]|nr:AlpA family phage regulatory protein [Rhodospirillaceae bacterium]MYK58443.1 AlpA family phage regulatory protein [Rhodospirillaceae bacterium]
MPDEPINPHALLLRRREVEIITGLRKSALYRAMKDGRFPRPCTVGPKCVRWRRADVENWVASLPATDSTEDSE